MAILARYRPPWLGRLRRLPSRLRRLPSRLGLVGLLGVSALVSAAGAVVAATTLHGPSAAAVGGNRPVDAAATDPTTPGTNNSPVLARSPRNPADVAVANRVDSPQYSCALHVSLDGGLHWRQTPVPFPTGEELPARCYAPDVAFGPNGVLYLSYVTLIGIGNSPHALWLATSTDGGRTLSRPVRVGGPLEFQARLAADPQVAGHLYLTWLQVRTTGNLFFPDVGNPITLSGSTDGGLTWSAPVQVSPPTRARVVAPSVAVGSGGALYVSYLDIGGDALDYNGGSGGNGGPAYAGPWTVMLARSTDGGRHWAQTVVDARVVPYTRFVVFLPPFPSLALDPARGRVYVGFTDARLGEPDVYVWASTDGGAHFSPGVRVDHAPAGDGRDKYLPALAAAPGGRLDVLYYTRQADPHDVADRAALASSYDGARTFGASVDLSDRAFDSRFAPNSIRNLPDLGSRLGLVSTDRSALAVWTDTRAGNLLSGKQDLAAEIVAFTPASSWQVPLLVVGAVLAVAGAILLVRSVRARRTTPTAATGLTVASP